MNKVKYFLVFGLMFSLFACQEEKKEEKPEEIIITWEDLKDITFEEKYYEDEKEWMLFPKFGHTLESIKDKQVSIEGYVVPIEPERYALSANPFASCFFCGNAGPESVIELELTSYDEIFFTDDYKTFTGKFVLNDTNINKMNYILKMAEVVPE